MDTISADAALYVVLGCILVGILALGGTAVLDADHAVHPACDSSTPFCGGTTGQITTGVGNFLQSTLRSTGRRVYTVLNGRPVQDTALFDPANGQVVATPAGRGDGYWTGAPATLYDDAEDVVYLYTRSRHPFARGWNATIWRTDTGETFEPVWSIQRDAINATSIEGAALHRAENGNYTLFLSYQDAASRQWNIMQITADTPAQFDPNTGTQITVPSYPHLKDPVIHQDTLYVHAPSADFRSTTTLAMNLLTASPRVQGALEVDHPTPTRLTTVIDTGEHRLGFYDWRPSIFHTGEEWSRYGHLNGSALTTATPTGAAITAGTGTGALRYITAEPVRDELWFFYEQATPTGEHQLYLNKVPAETVNQRINRITQTG